MKKIIITYFSLIFAQIGFAQGNYSLKFDYMSGYAVSNSSSELIFGDNYTFTVEAWYKNDGVNSGNNQGYDDGANIVSNYKRSGGGGPYNNFTFYMVPEGHGPTGTFMMNEHILLKDMMMDRHHVGIIENIRKFCNSYSLC